MRFRELRIEKNMSQVEIANQMGVKQNTVSQWENGERKPTADKLPKLARILGCTIDDLFKEDKQV